MDSLVGELEKLAIPLRVRQADGNRRESNRSETTTTPRTLTPYSAPVKPSEDEEQRRIEVTRRHKAIADELVRRYWLDQRLEPLDDDMLRLEVVSYDEHFTAAGIPTDRLRDVYLEACRTHGPYLLKVFDFVEAWRRIKAREEIQRAPPPCTFCGGTGRGKKYIPKQDVEVEVKCPYRRNRGTHLL
jgi:hypothetical protein